MPRAPLLPMQSRELRPRRTPQQSVCQLQALVTPSKTEAERQAGPRAAFREEEEGPSGCSPRLRDPQGTAVRARAQGDAALAALCRLMSGLWVPSEV